MAGAPGTHGRKTAVPAPDPIIFEGGSFMVCVGRAADLDALTAKVPGDIPCKKQPMKVPAGYETDA